MFIKQGIKPDNPFWKYVVGFVVIIMATFIGNLPFGIAVAVKGMMDGGKIPTAPNELMTMLDANLTLFLMMLAFVFTLGATFLVVRYLHGQTIREVTTGRKKTDWGRIFFSFGLWSIFTIVFTAIAYFGSPQDFEVNFNLGRFLILVVVAVLMVPIQTSAEEYLFRGYLMQGFAVLVRNKWFPLLTTSIIFGLMHIMNPEVEKIGYISMVYYIGTGLFLGILTLMDDGVELALGFHASNNLVGALLITSDWSAFQTDSILKDLSEPTVGFDILFPVVVIFPILLFIFSKKYGWTNWKERLTGTIEMPIDGFQKLANDTHTNEIPENNDNAYRNSDLP